MQALKNWCWWLVVHLCWGEEGTVCHCRSCVKTTRLFRVFHRKLPVGQVRGARHRISRRVKFNCGSSIDDLTELTITVFLELFHAFSRTITFNFYVQRFCKNCKRSICFSKDSLDDTRKNSTRRYVAIYRQSALSAISNDWHAPARLFFFVRRHLRCLLVCAKRSVLQGQKTSAKKPKTPACHSPRTHQPHNTDSRENKRLMESSCDTNTKSFRSRLKYLSSTAGA